MTEESQKKGEKLCEKIKRMRHNAETLARPDFTCQFLANHGDSLTAEQIATMQLLAVVFTKANLEKAEKELSLL